MFLYQHSGLDCSFSSKISYSPKMHCHLYFDHKPHSQAISRTLIQRSIYNDILKHFWLHILVWISSKIHLDVCWVKRYFHDANNQTRLKHSQKQRQQQQQQTERCSKLPTAQLSITSIYAPQ